MRRFVGLTILILGAVGFAPLAVALQPVEVTSAQGTTAWLVEDHTVPAFAVDVTIRHAGSAFDPAGKEGRASLAASLLMEGAGNYDSAAFHEALDFYAIRMQTDASRDDMSVSFTSLSEHADKAFSLLSAMLIEPHFEFEDAERLKKEQQTALAQKQGDPAYRAGIEFFATAFGDHPYARPSDGTVESVGALTAGDFLQFQAEKIKRDKLIISVTGDINPTQLKALLDRYIDPLPALKAETLELPDVTPKFARRAAQTLQVPQTVVYFALPGVPRASKDYYIAYVMNHLIGGSSLSSRMAKEIREKRGLAYYASSDLMELDKASLLVGSFATRNDEAEQAIAALKDVIGQAGEGGFTQKEFDEAISYITGAFPARLTSNRSVNQYLYSMQRYHLGKDYLEKRNSYIKTVTLAEVNALAKSLFKPENLLIITAGNPAAKTQPEKAR